MKILRQRCCEFWRHLEGPAQGFQKSKKFGRFTLGSGGEKTVKQSEKKCHGQTNKRSYGYFDSLLNRIDIFATKKKMEMPAGVQI